MGSPTPSSLAEIRPGLPKKLERQAKWYRMTLVLLTVVLCAVVAV